jgi:signal transduction histidine kinase/ActR/RegA family two-component response regulator
LQLIPELEKSWLQAYGKVAKTGEPVRIENYVEHMERWFDLYAFRFGNPANLQLGILFNNVTERKAVEARLTEAVAAADSANRAKSDFLANMSHELRTPLNAILGFAQLMEDGKHPPTAAQAQSLSQIVRAGWYLLELINDTLDLAAIEAGKLSMSPGTVSLAAVLQECAAIVAPLAEKRALLVTYPAPDAAHVVHADPIRIKQVMLNLLSNSVKYNRHGGSITVSCNTVGTDRSGPRLRISVQDTGLGLTPRQQEHLFEPFNRLGREHSGEVGTGIGLVLCKRLVELMSGHIGVVSGAGQGSNFWFELPLADANATLKPEEPPQTPAAAIAFAHVPYSHTVLHVDDNPANLELVELLLAQRQGLRLLNASHGGLGLEFARAHLPAVILMDINLPGISGTETLRILQSDPITAHIPVIALSANAMPREIQSGLQAGFFRYVTKPIRVHEFLDTLDQALLLAQQRSEGSPPANAGAQ